MADKTNSQPTLLTREQITKVDDRQIRTVDVPEWGGAVLVRGLNGAGRDEYFAQMAILRQAKGKPQMGIDSSNATAKLVARCVLDPEDPEREKLMFSYADVEMLGAKSGAALNRVYEASLELSGLSEEDMDELGKASSNTPSG